MGLYHIIFILREGLDIVGILYLFGYKMGVLFPKFCQICKSDTYKSAIR